MPGGLRLTRLSVWPVGLTTPGPSARTDNVLNNMVVLRVTTPVAAEMLGTVGLVEMTHGAPGNGIGVKRGPSETGGQGHGRQWQDMSFLFFLFVLCVHFFFVLRRKRQHKQKTTAKTNANVFPIHPSASEL